MEPFIVNWASLSLSLMNVVLLFWLGGTVLLNAERRNWGVWVAGLGLMMAGLFFVSHTIILTSATSLAKYHLSRDVYDFLGVTLTQETAAPELYFPIRTSRLDLWWRGGWLPLVALPFAWYMMMLWHVGFWEREEPNSNSELGTQRSPEGSKFLGRYTKSEMRRLRHRVGFWLALGLFIALLAVILFASPLPSFNQPFELQFYASIDTSALPLLLLLFAIYIVLCIGLALDALLHPAPSIRLMGDLARRRARPWLIGATSTLLAVGFLVGGAITWVLLNVQRTGKNPHYLLLTEARSRFDLGITLLITLAVLMVGQAIISYEVFTGKTLPSGSLRRSWLYAILLALGLGTIIGLCFVLQLGMVTVVLLATILMTLFYAFLNWRSFAQRQAYIHQLRPFVGSQHLYEQLLAPTDKGHFGLQAHQATAMEPEVDIESLFRVFCRDVLDVQSAYLAPLGSLASLVRTPLLFPPQRQAAPSIDALLNLALRQQLATPTVICTSLNPDEAHGFVWGVPLWSERGLIGLFFLGPKREGLYTQEEIEIARATGERLLDTSASVEISHRLMMLQRQQLATSQILDRQTRRLLHDEVLPQLHTALLTLGSRSEQATSEAITLLTNTHRQVADLLHDAPISHGQDVHALGLMGALQKLLDEEFGTAFDEVTWERSPTAQVAIDALSPLTSEVLFYAAREAIRNAARYGRGQQHKRLLQLHIRLHATTALTIEIEDDGVGMQAVENGNHGTGHGLALHSTMLAIVGGEMRVESELDQFTRVLIRIADNQFAQL